LCRRCRSLDQFIRMVIKQMIVITEGYHVFQLGTKLLSIICCQVYLYVQGKLVGIINVDFENVNPMQLVRLLKCVCKIL
jgi:hypothetical protein